MAGRRAQRVSLYLRVSPTIKEALDRFAEENGISLNAAAELHLEAALERGIEYEVITQLKPSEEADDNGGNAA